MRILRHIIALVSTLTLLVLVSVAQAVPITRAFGFNVSGFTPAAPIDPVSGSVSVTFDPGGGDVTDAPVDDFSINLPNSGTVLFTYFSSFDQMLIFDALNGSSISNFTNDFELLLAGVSTDSPIVSQLTYTQSDSEEFFSNSGGSDVTVQEVPLTPTALLLLTGLIGVGLMGWRRSASG